MKSLVLYDNSDAEWPLEPDVVGDPCTIGLLLRYSGKTLSDLKQEGDDQIVVVGRDGGPDENIPFFMVYPISYDKDDPNKVVRVRIVTSNLMGVVRLPDRKTHGGLVVEVRSRFDRQGEDPNRGQPFVNYLLSRIYDVDFAGLVPADNQSSWDVLVALQFVRLLGEAISGGLYKQYRNFRLNDFNFKGRLDLARHIRENMPVGRGIAYEKREIVFDVPLNHLLRHAAELIDKKWPGMIARNHAALKMLALLRVNTPTWNARGASEILRRKDSHCQVMHPFFRERYEPLRELAVMLLSDDCIGVYGADEEREVSGVIFNGAWLWEEYLATVLTPKGFVHSDCASIGRHDVFSDCHNQYGQGLYPDFYREHHGGIVLDAKYKHSPQGLKSDVQRLDVFQMMTYVLNTGARTAGLIYPPVPRGENKSSANVISPLVNCRWRTFAYAPMDPDVEIEKYMMEQERELLLFTGADECDVE